MFIHKRTVIVVALSVMIFTATSSVLIALKDAPAAFVSQGDYVVSSRSAPTIFSSQVDVEMASVMSAIDKITGAYPEVLAFSSYDSESFVVRGVEMSEFLDSLVSEDQLLDDALPEHYSGAVIGDRLLGRLGVSVPFLLPLVGSYSAKVELVNVTAAFRTDTSIDDELVTSLEVARSLCGMPEDKASIISLRTDDPEWLSETLSPSKPRFALYDLTTSDPEIVVDRPITVKVSIVNWGGSAGSTTVEVKQNGFLITTMSVSLNASESRVLSHTFYSICADTSRVQDISLETTDELPSSVEVGLRLMRPYVTFAKPEMAFLGSVFEVSMRTYLGEPVEGVTISIVEDGVVHATSATDAEGVASFEADELGTYSLEFSGLWGVFDGYDVLPEGTWSIEVVDPASFPAEFLPQVTSFFVTPQTVRESESLTGTATVTNGGSVGGSFNISVMVSNSEHMRVQVSLGPLESEKAVFEIEGLAVGRYSVQVGFFSREVEVVPWFVENDDFVQLVVRYGGSTQFSSASSIPIYQAAKISEGNVSVALFALGAISGLLSTLAIVSVFHKELAQGRRRLGILKSIGASGSAIRRLVFFEAIILGLAGTVAGLVMGIVAAVLLTDGGAVMVFGHQLEFGVSPSLLLVVLVGSISICVASALASAQMAVRETTIASIRGLPQEMPEHQDIDELLESL